MLRATAGHASARPPGRTAGPRPGSAIRRDGAPEGDRLAISQDAKKALAGGTGTPDPGSEGGSKTGEPVTDPPKRGQEVGEREPESPKRGPEVDGEVTDRDATVGIRLGERFRLSGRVIHASPTMMQGAGLLKLDYDLSPGTTAFVGAGHMPGFFRNSIGPNTRIDSPHSVAFAGIESAGGKTFDLGGGFRADLDVHAVAVATMAYNHELSKIDPNSSAGLSKATVTGEASVSRRLGNLDATVGYGNHLDLGMIGSYYVTGGRGLFPQTHFIHAGVNGIAGPVAYRADAYLPFASASNEFASDPRFRVAASTPGVPWLPDVSAMASSRGLDGLELSKTWNVASSLNLSAFTAVDMPFERDPVMRAGVALRYSFGGPSKPRSATRPGRDWRTEPPRRRYSGPAATVGKPRLRDFFSPAEIKAMKGKSVEELAQILKTPEQVVAYLDHFVGYDYDRLKDAGGDYGSLTPNEVAALLKGVCRDQHPFIVSVMKEGQGVEGRTMGYVSPDTSHAIAVYKDPKTGRWNVAEYGNIHYTQAATAEEAFERVRPDALVYSDWSGGGPNDKQHQVNIRYSETAREYYRFVQPSLGVR